MSEGSGNGSGNRYSNAAGQNGGNRPAQRPVAPLSAVFRTKLKQPQFYWFLGHTLCLYYYIQYMLSFREQSVKTNYRKIMLYTVISYGIVLHQYVKSKQLRFQWSNLKQQIRQLDNLQYFTLSIVLLICSLSGGKTLTQTESSMVIYSLFHALNYFKENVLPFIPMNPMLKGSLSNKISYFITNFNGSFFHAAVMSELVTMCKVCLMLPIQLISVLITFNAKSLFTLLSIWAYAVFFKLRYNQSEQMRLLCNQNQMMIENFISTRLPMFMDKWLGIKHLAKVFFDRILA